MAARAKGMAAQQPQHGEPRAPHGAVALDAELRITRAGWLETTTIAE